jgi:hypothetical protein
MDETYQNQESSKGRRKGLWVTAVILILALVGFGGYKGWQIYQDRVEQARMAEIQAEAAAQIEDQWGIRIVHVALVAQGGLLDLRYQVTNPEKAYDLFDAVEYIPRVIAEDGTEMSMNDDPHTHDLEFGYQYFFLLRNIGGSVQPGSYVSVAVGDKVLPFVPVESS